MFYLFVAIIISGAWVSMFLFIFFGLIVKDDWEQRHKKTMTLKHLAQDTVESLNNYLLDRDYSKQILKLPLARSGINWGEVHRVPNIEEPRE